MLPNGYSGMESNFRSALPVDGRGVFGGGFGSTTAPPLPPRPIYSTATQAGGFFPQTGGYSGMYGGGGYGSGFGNGFMSNYGGGGYNGFSGGGMYNSYGSGMYGNSYNSFMPHQQNNYLESRFVQMAEENSRPAFQSIESFVGVVGNFASMLDSTFFGLTSSFRAILGVTANLGRLRAMFGDFLSSFALIKGLRWLWRKVLFSLSISKVDPSSQLFKEAFQLASQTGPDAIPPTSSAWPMIMFLGFIFSAPYLIMKVFGSPEKVQSEQDPRKWINSIESQAIHSFTASTPQELTINTGDVIFVAPKEVQNQCRLMNTGWALATKDFIASGLVPINYIQRKQSIPQAPSSRIFPTTTVQSEKPNPNEVIVNNDVLESNA